MSFSDVDLDKLLATSDDNSCLTVGYNMWRKVIVDKWLTAWKLYIYIYIYIYMHIYIYIYTFKTKILNLKRSRD